LLAISRCFAGSIAAKPRFDPPLLVVGIIASPHERQPGNAPFGAQFIMLIEVRNGCRDARYAAGGREIEVTLEPSGSRKFSAVGKVVRADFGRRAGVEQGA
jgi:hypothetical protein